MTDALFDLQPDWSGEMVIREAPTAGREWALTYHYARAIPSSSLFYGAFKPDLICVVGVGTGANRHGMAKGLGLDRWKGDLEITRVICHPDAPKNTASQSVAGVMRYVHRQKGAEWLFSYADTAQNHHGGIYQALNALYVGLSNPFTYGYFLDGKRVHQRSVSAMYGTVKWPDAPDAAAAQGQTLTRERDVDKPKHCYILPCSTPAVNRAIRKALQPHVKPYPKRDPA